MFSISFPLHFLCFRGVSLKQITWEKMWHNNKGQTDVCVWVPVRDTNLCELGDREQEKLESIWSTACPLIMIPNYKGNIKI